MCGVIDGVEDISGRVAHHVLDFPHAVRWQVLVHLFAGGHGFFDTAEGVLAGNLAVERNARSAGGVVHAQPHVPVDLHGGRTVGILHHLGPHLRPAVEPRHPGVHGSLAGLRVDGDVRFGEFLEVVLGLLLGRRGDSAVHPHEVFGEGAVRAFAFDQVLPVGLGQAGPPLGLFVRARLQHVLQALFKLLAVGFGLSRLPGLLLQPYLCAVAEVLDLVQDAGAAGAAAGLVGGLFLLVGVLEEQLGVMPEAGRYPFQAGAVVP